MKPPPVTQAEKGLPSISCDEGKLSRSDVDSSSYLKDEIQVIIKEMECKYVDVSPLKKLLNSFFEFSSSYDQARSIIHHMDVDSAKKKLFIAAGERLTNAMFVEKDKVEVVSSLHQSLDNMKKVIKALCKRAQDLEVLLTVVEDEVEGAKLETLFEVKEFDACFNGDLLNGLR
ncbi:hypothetical protein KY285_023632 [Solanum tuberosum]|nr:hypothetical protein KY289_026076 [Solanum tuberosum]KAH0675831.1 hypothetical protein KY285_023632 [Solanum tuberosum]